ncbi:ABC-three component system middle component 5 [Comamonas testosteroni]|uniref:ABC-three component system middle component 5 n=1 Tax=Comamonas testosteroni TaxID=285 RepID=UPI003AEFF180
MLIYHPALDAYHCVFRVLALLSEYDEIEKDRLQILDFVLCFPSVASAFRLPPGAAKAKRAMSSSDSPYRSPMNPKGMFMSLTKTQDAAIACLEAAALLRRDQAVDVDVRRADKILPFELQERVDALKVLEAPFFKDMLPLLMSLPLRGPDGLKARSGLAEYRYDSP